MYIVTCKTSIVYKYFTQQAMPLAPQWNLLSRLARSVQLKNAMIKLLGFIAMVMYTGISWNIWDIIYIYVHI